MELKKTKHIRKVTVSVGSSTMTFSDCFTMLRPRLHLDVCRLGYLPTLKFKSVTKET